MDELQSRKRPAKQRNVGSGSRICAGIGWGDIFNPQSEVTFTFALLDRSDNPIEQIGFRQK
jgi:hypothetical protein